MSGVMMRMRSRSGAMANPNGAFTSALCSVLLSHVFVTLSTYVPPTTIFCGLFTQAPTVAGGGIEVTGDPNYTRRPMAFGMPFGPPYVTQNTSEVDWLVATVDWGFIAAAALFDQASGGSMLAFGLLLGADGVTPTPRLVQAGDVFLVPAAGLQIGLT